MIRLENDVCGGARDSDLSMRRARGARVEGVIDLRVCSGVFSLLRKIRVVKIPFKESLSGDIF